MEMQETWKNIEGYKGHYQISNIGRVKSLKYNKEKILKQATNRQIYKYVSLSFNNVTHIKKIHRLVAEHFVNKPEYKCEVNHKDANKLNNHFKNLEWITHSENLKHAYANKLNNHFKNLEWITHSENLKHAYANKLISRPYKGRYGKDHYKSKPVIQYDINNNFITEFESLKDAFNKTGIYQSSISTVCNKKAKTAGGYKWEFINK